MTAESRKELAKSIRAEYAKATFKRKTELLHGFVVATGYNRKYAMGLLKSEPAEKGKRQRPRVYDEKAREALICCWEAANYICAKRLVPFLPVLLGCLERSGRLQLENETLAKLLKLSAATADRILKRERAERHKNPALTKPGSLLRKHIEIRTFADWNDARPGFFEADTVGHHGGNIRGTFAHTLTMTDIATGWTELVALRSKTEEEALRAIQTIRKTIPFKLLGIDTDNGSEFMNYGLIGWCEQEKLTFTRSREYKKNDQCYVEEKNGSVVRKLVGHYRYESAKAFGLLESLYELARIYVNYFQPSVKLKTKSREGAKAKRKYDVAQTPFQRLLAFGIDDEQKQWLQAEFESLDPVRLLDEIRRLQHALQEVGHRHVEVVEPAEVSTPLPSAMNKSEKRTTQKQKPPKGKTSNKTNVVQAVWTRFLSLPNEATMSRHDLADLGKPATVSMAINELVKRGFIEKVGWGTYRRTSNQHPVQIPSNTPGITAAIRDHFLKHEGQPVSIKELLLLGDNLTVRHAIAKLKSRGFIESCGWGKYKR